MAKPYNRSGNPASSFAISFCLPRKTGLDPCDGSNTRAARNISDFVPSLSASDLLAAARAALQWAVAPSSNFRVGASLLTSQQMIYSGCNIESPVYLGICAERVALFKALSEGARAFITLAIVPEAAVSCLPCGTCRQLLWEFAPDLEILIALHHPSRAETVVRYSLKDLLPFPFERTGHGPFRS